MTIRVPVTQMKMWGLDETLTGMKHVLQHVIQNAPTQQEAPDMKGHFPSERVWLPHCQDRAFENDLRRYARYAKDMLSPRQIAYLEQQEQKGMELKAEAIPKKIRHNVSGESGVSESIKRVFEGIYLRPFTGAWQNRKTAIPADWTPYHCDIHDTDCPTTCQNLMAWMKKYEVALPAMSHGQLPGETRLNVLDELPNKRNRN